jgi:acetyltransferase
MTVESASAVDPGRSARIDAMLRPRSVAVLGASAKRVASGNEVVANLLRHGFDGDLYLVHPRETEIQGVAAVASVDQLPRGLDCALVSLPATAVIGALEELEAIGCRAAIVPTIGLGPADVRRFETLARSGRMAIHGPNSMGILNFTDDLPLWFYDGMLTEEPPGSMALVGQSGSACLFIARTAERARFSKIISSGNELGVTTGDYLSWLADDPHTEAAGVVLESLRDVPGFAAAVAKMRAVGKPLAVLKVGRTTIGARMAIAHTGALIGSDDAYAALFDELDVPTVDDYDELATLLECWSQPRLAAPRGTRVAVMTISGGQAALAADLAVAQRVQVAELSRATARELEAAIPGTEGVNPYDAGAGPATRKTFAGAIRTLAADPGVDSVAVVMDAQYTLNDAEIAYTREIFEAIAEVGPSVVGKPVVVASSSALSRHPECERRLGDVPLLRGIPATLAALRGLAANQRAIAPRELRAAVAGNALGNDLPGPGPLPAELSARLLSAYGLPVVRSELAVDEAAAVRAADAIGYPVVVKVASPDVPHRADVGGVAVGLADAAAVQAAVRAVRASVQAALPGARLDGFEVQEHVTGSLEAVVGFVSDPVFGATMVVGAGGALVELLDDRAVGLAPLDTTRARSLVAGTRLAAVAAGYRNLAPPTPLDGLVEVLVGFSRLASDLAPWLGEGDLNPVLIEPGSGRARLVDCLLVAKDSPNGRGR